MDQTRFAEKHGQALLKKIIKICQTQDLDTNLILYEYHQSFLKAGKNKQEIEKILADISLANKRDNLLIKEQRNTFIEKVKKDITPIQVEPGEQKCPKCGGMFSMRTMAQLASGDEATSQLYRCVNPEKPNCKHKWRRR